jgi:hypothetical protein
MTTTSHTSKTTTASTSKTTTSSTSKTTTSSTSKTTTSHTSKTTTSSTSKTTTSGTSKTSKSSTTTKPLYSTQGCNADNCLRALELSVIESSAYAFCRSFLSTTVPTASTTGIPSYPANCGPTSIVSRISSACPCFLATYTPATTISTTSSKSSSTFNYIV